MANKTLDRTAAPRREFGCDRLFGRWIRCQRPLTAAVGQLGSSVKLMKRELNCDQFPMLNAAWNAAMALVDWNGDLKADIDSAEIKFLKRKSCLALPANCCKTAFRDSINIIRHAAKFRRSRCGTLPPKATRRYELLHALAVELEESYSSAEDYLILAGCRLIELSWDR